MNFDFSLLIKFSWLFFFDKRRVLFINSFFVLLFIKDNFLFCFSNLSTLLDKYFIFSISSLYSIPFVKFSILLFININCISFFGMLFFLFSLVEVLEDFPLYILLSFELFCSMNFLLNSKRFFFVFSKFCIIF